VLIPVPPLPIPTMPLKVILGVLVGLMTLSGNAALTLVTVPPPVPGNV
jgi:hypothetical protein